MEKFEKKKFIAPEITVDDLMPMEECLKLESAELKETGKIENEIYCVEGMGKTVRYFGVAHSHDPEDPMFVEIEREFNVAKPAVVLVEGLYGLVTRGRGALRGIKELKREEAIREMGDAGFVAKLALERGIKVICPEPNQRDLVRHLLIKQEFSRDEIFAFYAFRQIPNFHQIYKEGNAEIFENYISHYIDWFKSITEWENFDYSLGHVREIGKNLWGGDINLEDKKFYDTKVGPIVDVESVEMHTAINDISKATSYFRDVHIVNQLGEVLKDFDRVFIVYGGSHVRMQKPAIKKLLGVESK